MASFGDGHQRPSTAVTSAANTVQSETKESKNSSPQMIRKLGQFALNLLHFAGILLFILSLIPRHKIPLILMVILTYLASPYALMLGFRRVTMPNSNTFVYKLVDRRIVLGLLVVAVVLVG
ncbi:hypothetical protein MANES_11G122400v8 [Manihot esculenta]|uniref:PRA1 family protein n=1 Tax=Manihot esculenta TaxID=3983 RepID=A0A2C9V0Q2_MANES|nr:hypothetical protein MANES_11G122400v8 [Manihot esculenta]